jgi:hypothetical protein
MANMARRKAQLRARGDAGQASDSQGDDMAGDSQGDDAQSHGVQDE